MSDWRNPRTVEYRDRTLSLAVRVTDAYTGEHPDVHVDVSLVDRADEPVANPSDYYVWLDMTAPWVRLEVDAGDEYFPEERAVVLPGGDPSAAPDGAVVVDDPMDPVEVVLTPTPAYRFPGTATTVRGHVRDADGDGVEGARVTLAEFDPVARTTGTGEYALWVHAGSDDVQKTDGKRLVRVGDGGALDANGIEELDGENPTLEVTHPDFEEYGERIEVEAGARTVEHVTLE